MTAEATRASRGTRTGLGFVLPPDWFVLDLRDDILLGRQIHGLVLRQVGRREEDATTRARLRRQLHDTAEQAIRVGGVHLALSLMDVTGIPVPASLTTYHLDTAVTTLAGILDGAAHEGRVVEVVDGPLGEMARCVGVFRSDPAPSRPDDDASGAAPQVRADYWIDAGPGHGITLLAFSSPLVDLADAMVELFESVVSTVHVFPEASAENDEMTEAP